ncbi:SDR family oxidoreductase [Nocardioides sp. GY 10127]|uniref:SDR family NAD(P)-dependent oxidoreductase n=1 Tax=Nocardioides sp. GY 10127 TaxID=2569762 RepID=UPI0010A8C877|nr:SDR family oxidoreductase [Nocardioides sp. GY 10127]TIC84244.1 SDR family oxidoreductase [Nocardioides sp. GY 10127]
MTENTSPTTTPQTTTPQTVTTQAVGAARVALVTGGNRGLGCSEALHLARGGADVVLTYRANEAEALDVVRSIEKEGRRAAALRLDVTAPETFEAFAATLRATLADTFDADGLDVLVNNAGNAGWTPLGETDVAEVRRLLDTHVTGPVMLTQALAPLLRDGGRIVNTSTGLARFTGADGYSVYAAAKGAVEVWTRYLAKTLAPRGITVNTVAPGATGTDFGGGSMRDDEDVRGHLSSVIAMGRVGEPDDIGATVAAIASPAFAWVTGQRIEASGGMNL